MNNKKKITLMFTFLLAAFLFNVTTYAAAIKAKEKASALVVSSTSPSADSEDAALDSKIIITFNKAIKKNINFDKIKLLNEDNDATDANIKIEGNKIKIDPKNLLSLLTNYKVVIPANSIKDTSNIAFKKDYRFSFTTKGLDIASIDDIIVNVNVGDDYKLPDQVKATLKDGSTKDVGITWQDAKVDTSQEGYTIYVGFVDGYDNPVTLTLNVNATTEITQIDDIDQTINAGDNYTLPSQVTATLSDGTTTEVPVIWDQSTIDTSTPGDYIFTGTVDNYDNPITLTLTIE